MKRTTISQYAESHNISRAYLDRLLREKGSPDPIEQYGQTRIYDADELDAWNKARPKRKKV